MLAVVAVAVSLVIMNWRLESGMNKVYGQYVNMQTFVYRATLSAVKNLPRYTRAGLAFFMCGLIGAGVAVSALLERFVFFAEGRPAGRSRPRGSGFGPPP
ncbi:MAG: hypothetical protein M5R36_22150 [Deltaproteobacteria bacterium]|nr:hypothetical protein [Deltaproteobacteria bacterium]